MTLPATTDSRAGTTLGGNRMLTDLEGPECPIRRQHRYRYRLQPPLRLQIRRRPLLRLFRLPVHYASSTSRIDGGRPGDWPPSRSVVSHILSLQSSCRKAPSWNLKKDFTDERCAGRSGDRNTREEVARSLKRRGLLFTVDERCCLKGTLWTLEAPRRRTKNQATQDILEHEGMFSSPRALQRVGSMRD